MKKKIALFANGWTTENLINFTNSLKASLPVNFADIYMFVSHESYGQTDEEHNGQNMIFKLPDLSLFDLAIVFYPGLNFEHSINYIYDAIKKANIPAISIGNNNDTDNISIGIDNYSGMLDLCNYLIDIKHCKNIVYLGGAEDNDDSNERLRALNDALSSHGLPAPTIYYTNWESGYARYIIQFNHGTKETKPDAIVCANDILASFATYAMEDNGFNVPADVLVTGFDHLKRYQIFYPSIATVDQNYDKLGTCTADAVVKLLIDNVTAQNTVIPCTFIPAESCGCFNVTSDSLRREYTHNFPHHDQGEYLFSLRMFAIEQNILQATNYTNLKNNLKGIFNNNNIGPEGDSFFFMMDPAFEGIGRDLKYTPNKFCDEMDIIIGKYRGQIYDGTTIMTKDLVPVYEDSNENNIYMFSPIFYMDYICGYLVFINDTSLLDRSLLYNFENKINRILITLKYNLQLNELNSRLSELMDKDTLTNVKNRAAYDKYIKLLEKDFIEGENEPFAVVYFDINNLKMVNDTYGHEKGDAYIRNSCRLICNTFKHSPVFRVGGDEFISIVINDDFINRHALLDGMREHMSVLKSKGQSVPLTERISIATGMAEYDRTLDEDFSSIFRRADEIMYENKYKMKNEKN